MPSRKVMKGNGEDHLTPQQQAGVDLLVSGKTLTDAAEVLGVTRETVSTWTNHNPVFIAALNQRRGELWESQVETLRGLLPRALAVLAAAMEGDNPLPAALAVLKSCGLAQGLGRPTGPTTEAEAERALRLREIEQAATALTEADVQVAMRQREQTRLLAELTTFP